MANAGHMRGVRRAREATLRGKQMAVLPVAAYGGAKDASAAWPAAGAAPAGWGRSEDLQERWEEHTAIMVYDGRLPPTEGGEEMQTACLRRPLASAPSVLRQPRRSGPQQGVARSGQASRNGLG
jgi:hypothetical protein